MLGQSGPTKHVAIVGVTGAGKSTLVNVLVGPNTTPVSNDATPCTMKAKQHVIKEVGVTLWDTRGLNEASEQGATVPIMRFFSFLRRRPDAERKLRKLLRRKNPKIGLILFCVRAEKIHVSAQWKNYHKIYDEICKRNVEMAVVVTHKGLNTREDWKATCQSMVRNVVGVPLDEKRIEAVPERDSTGDCKSRILSLICKFA